MKKFKEFLREEADTGITDEWFNHEDTFVAFKPPKPIQYQIAQTSGTTETLEGPVRHEAGHSIVTGPKGEKYPIAPEKFEQLYDLDEKGTATPKKILKRVRPSDHAGVLKTSWGDLSYKPGDLVVRHGTGDYGVVAPDIFATTYQLHDEEILEEYEAYLDIPKKKKKRSKKKAKRFYSPYYGYSLYGYNNNNTEGESGGEGGGEGGGGE